MAISVPGAMAGSELAALSIPAELVAGTGNPMVKASAFDVAPSPATVMLAVPAVAMSAAGTLAVNWDALTNVVASGAPFHCTLELAVKPAPVTVRVKAAPPGAAALGLRLAREAAAVVEMDSASTLEVRGPVLETVILAVPGAAIKAADTCAVNCVALTPVVGSARCIGNQQAQLSHRIIFGTRSGSQVWWRVQQWCDCPQTGQVQGKMDTERVGANQVSGTKLHRIECVAIAQRDPGGVRAVHLHAFNQMPWDVLEGFASLDDQAILNGLRIRRETHFVDDRQLRDSGFGARIIHN